MIEASAGTGKSWTVTLLYLRLIIEKNLTVDQILVVTFTDAATKELRDDIRNRLTEALAAFEQEIYLKEDEYSTLMASIDALAIRKEDAIWALNRAKLSLDEAAIFTIHSFCQRALSESAFEAGLPFQNELMDADYELMQKLTDDFWRRNFYQAPPALLFKLQQHRITPDTLLNDVSIAVGKPYLEIYGPAAADPEPEKWQRLTTLFNEAIASWQKNRQTLIALIQNPEQEEAYLVSFKNSADFCLSMMDEYAKTGHLPSSINSKLYWFGTKNKTKAKFDNIEHSFFQHWQSFLDCWDALNASSEDYINHIRIRLLQYLQTELPKEKLRLGVLSFDDLLLQLNKALNNNPKLAEGLCKKYKAALIDEFQDTDPIQYKIFSRIFAKQSNHAVFLVGDPKQAIYSFRGGDIHTYLKAKSDIPEDKHYTLTTNWRSHPKLVSAFNTLYLSSDNPFKDKGIDYIKVDAGNLVNDALVSPDKASPLRLWRINLDKDEPKSVVEIREEIANAVAGDIAKHLNEAQKNRCKIGDKEISGGDIAVLVRSHTQGDLIKQALTARGIPSVQSSKENIFQTHEAEEISRLLTSIIEPQREDLLRAALVTDLLGYKAKDLLHFEEDGNAWEEKLLAIQKWHQLWQRKGFLPMMRDLMRAEKMHQHLLAFPDGERRLTNILHLSELIHSQSKKHSLGMQEVLRWLQQQRQNPNSKEAELRLESDEKLVKIVTIHKSKGLEYPIIYCPFVGLSSKAITSNVFIFHKDKKACLEIGSVDKTEHKQIKIKEESAEDTRLLYVALTRAKYQCTVVCAPEPIKGSPDRSALGWLLTNGMALKSGSSKAVVANNEAYFQSYVDRLEMLSQHEAIDCLDMPIFGENECLCPPEISLKRVARTFSATIRHQAQMTSFSGLTAGAHSESPDYDLVERGIDSVKVEAQKVEEFPRGATAGTALHEIFETIDFEKNLDDQMDLFEKILGKWAFDQKYQTAAKQLIQNTLCENIIDEFSLNQLKTRQRLDEMEFYLPLNQLKTKDLKQLLFKHLPEQWQAVRNAVTTLYFEQIEGYLKGFIDLIFEHKGKYYLADYKSNSLNDYTQDSLLVTMADSHYYLQLLLYSVALNRYLQKRVENYSWDDHFGGAYYLFIRGMNQNNHQGNNKEHDNKITADGVFFYKPDKTLIDAMDSLFSESLI